MKLLINEQPKSYENTKFAIFIKNNFKINMLKTKSIVRARRTVIIQGNTEIFLKVYVI